MSSSKVTKNWGQKIALGLIRLYQLTLSPFIGQQCRFYPSCSHYAQEAIELHGVIRGSWLALTRLGRCHPFTAGGVDHVPQPSHLSTYDHRQPKAKELL